jgi:hypothetical protein
MQPAAGQQTEQWYRDREWNIDLFGAYAFPGNGFRADRYLGADHAWGGGIAGSYFFLRSLGLGLEGFLLDAEDVIGQTSGNLIFRYPISSSRFAPYGYAGGGGMTLASTGQRCAAAMTKCGTSPAAAR